MLLCSEVIKNWLPSVVIYQFAPLDIPAAIDAFLGHWKPDAVVLMESELWPNLIIGASKRGIALALVNARMSEKSFKNWSGCFVLPLISLLLSKFTLIAPLSNVQAIRFQLLQASPTVINFCGDLKYVTEEFDISNQNRRSIEDLRTLLSCQKVWMASSIHKGEEEVMLCVQKRLQRQHPDLVTILVPRHPKHGREISLRLQREGVNTALRSRGDQIILGTSIYIVDTLGELRDLYKLSPIAVIGGSFLPDMAGHNLSEAATAGCAILTGHHIGHFAHMVEEMQRIDPASVTQVSGKEELHKALNELLSNPTVLERHRSASRRAIYGLSSGIIENIWNKLDYYVLRNARFARKTFA